MIRLPPKIHFELPIRLPLCLRSLSKKKAFLVTLDTLTSVPWEKFRRPNNCVLVSSAKLTLSPRHPAVWTGKRLAHVMSFSFILTLLACSLGKSLPKLGQKTVRKGRVGPSCMPIAMAVSSFCFAAHYRKRKGEGLKLAY